MRAAVRVAAAVAGAPLPACQIEALLAEGLEFLEGVKARFLEQLEGYRAQVDGFCQQEAEKGHALAHETLQAEARMTRAHALVQSLGITALHRDQAVGDML